jgi:hypothetical protein
MNLDVIEEPLFRIHRDWWCRSSHQWRQGCGVGVGVGGGSGGISVWRLVRQRRRLGDLRDGVLHASGELELKDIMHHSHRVVDRGRCRLWLVITCQRAHARTDTGQTDSFAQAHKKGQMWVR